MRAQHVGYKCTSVGSSGFDGRHVLIRARSLALTDAQTSLCSTTSIFSNLPCLVSAAVPTGAGRTQAVTQSGSNPKGNNT